MMLAAAGDFDAARQSQRRALVIDPQNVQAYIALSNLALLQNGDVDAATRVLDQMAPGTPVNADVATTRIDLLLYQRRFAAARAMAEQYADTFTTGPARSEEHTSELQSLMRISYAVFCLKKKKKHN